MLVLSPLVAAAATLEVGPNNTYTSIQAAHDDANPGDTIELDPFTFVEDVDITKDVWLRSVFGNSLTFIEGDITITDADVTVSDITFTPTTRAFDIDADSEVLFEDVIVIGIENEVNGVGFRVQGGSFVDITNTQIDGFDAVGLNGAAIASFGATVLVTDSTISDTEAHSGGAIHADDGVITLTRSTFTDNAASFQDTGFGGVVHGINTAIIELDHADFEGPTAGQNGGAIHLTDGQLIVTGGFISDAQADLHGGVFYLDQTDANITELVITNAVAGGHGGAIWMSGGEAEIYNTTFEDGRAALSGAGIRSLGADIDLISGSFTRNTVSDPLGVGGAISIIDAQLIVNGTFFRDNAATTEGGAVRLTDSGGSFTGAFFERNDAQLGGAIHHDGDEGLVVDSTLLADNSADRGAGVYWTPEANPSTLTVRGSELRGNVAGAQGGGLFLSSGATVALIDNSFTDNQAGDGGGAWISTLDDLFGRGNLFCKNTATSNDGGGVLVDKVDEVTWNNSSFVENTAAKTGGGFVVSGAEIVEVANSAFLGNRANKGGGAHVQQGDLSFWNTLVAQQRDGSGLTAAQTDSVELTYNLWHDNLDDNVGANLDSSDLGMGNLFEDPMLAAYSLDGDCTNDVIWPQLGSPLVDAGDPDEDDLDGSRSDIGPTGGLEADDTPWVDLDGDGSPAMFDCNDTNEDVSPDAEEVPYDRLDNDCVDGDACDLDGDGFDHEDCGGRDCDDDDADIFPGNEDVPADGIDQDCNGADQEEVPDDEDPEPKDPKTCGCATGPSAGWLWIPLFMVALRRR